MACTPVKRVLEVDSVYTSPEKKPPKRKKYAADLDLSSIPDVQLTPSKPSGEKSPFKDLPWYASKFDQMADSIKDEAQQVHRKKRLGSVGCLDVDRAGIRTEKPLFTYSQISLICEKKLREQEQKIREEYEKVLNEKLAEQYDTFVKFTYDQIQKKFRETYPSYLS